MKIHYIQPFALDKDIGKAYNEEIQMILKSPNSSDIDWVCITDQDIMFLEPETKALIAKVVETQSEFKLLSCYTNRLGIEPGQLHEGRRSDDPDIRNHIAIAKGRRGLYGTEVHDYDGPVAGMLMLFPLWWGRIMPFVEGKYSDVNFDIHFTQVVKNRGYKVGLMAGVYVFHLYRFGQDDPQQQIKHLL